jgi:hypothetical protein
MQTTQYVTEAQLDELIEAVYANGAPVVKQAYSDFDAPTLTFPSAPDLRADIRFVPEQRASFFYALYYPDTKGFVLEKRIELKPRAGKGHTHRFSQAGWGLIFLDITSQNRSRLKCGVAVNSVARARLWFDTCPELQSPDLWDWIAVNRRAGRLVRLLRKLGKHSE